MTKHATSEKTMSAEQLAQIRQKAVAAMDSGTNTLATLNDIGDYFAARQRWHDENPDGLEIWDDPWSEE